MKKQTKFFLVAIAALITIGSIALVSCDKDSQIPLYKGVSHNTVKNQNNPISNPNNPYDYLGFLHNEVLDSVLLNPSSDSLLENAHIKTGAFIKSIFPLSSFTSSSFEESMLKANQGYRLMTDIILKRMTVSELGYNNELEPYVAEMYSICDSLIARNELFTPNEFAEKIIIIENKVLSYNKHNMPNYSTGNTEMNQYDNVLASLAIARYSYTYWYDVATNDDNPLHDGFRGTPTYICCPPLKELWDSIANVAEKVADVAVAVWADITSGETVVYYDDLDNEVGRSTTWYLDKAVEASEKAYNDRQH